MRPLWLFPLFVGSLSAFVNAEDGPRIEKAWPGGGTIAEHSTSPDGRYGVWLPTREEAPEDDDKIINALVDLHTHARLAVIQKAHYFPGYNHHDLNVRWAPDSSWCIVTYGARYGFAAITLLEPRGDTCQQTDLGVFVQKALDAAIDRQGKGARGGCGIAYFRPAGSKIIVRATDQTNPKAFAEEPTYCAFFQGTFDLKARKWPRSEARKTDLDEMTLLQGVFSDDLEESRVFDGEADRLKFYDRKLNEVYRGIRRLLPASRFANLKKQQLAWLKTLEAAASEATKVQLIAQRIGELQKLAWEP